MTHRIIHPQQLSPVPWANGLGTTREIATGVSALRGADQGPGFRWRISLADLTQSSPFSRLAGVDRVFTLVTPGPVRLTVHGQARRVDPGVPVSFAGEDDVAVELGSAGPQQALNLMVDRSQARGAVHVRQLEGAPAELPGETVGVAVLSGAVTLPDGRLAERGHLIRPEGRLRLVGRPRAVVACAEVSPAGAGSAED
ncbi:HutD/Ves family protein [Nesterenkonia sp. K-15-9-6]|uniref:HutD/Ves family protein n=1 Tax=Nesterenkonia sp. K-15-9-6 TaxID=3093918 RepID=UPI004044757E